MPQAKFSLSQAQVDFLEQFRTLGYADKSSMVREALEVFRRNLARQELERSAELYAEVYAEDEDLQSLTEQAIEGWPE